MNENVTPEIWQEFHKKLLLFIRSKVKSNEDAEDILQNVFIKIHKSISSVKENEKLPSWVYQVTRNTINDCYRSCYRMDTVEYDDSISILNETDEKNLNGEVSKNIEALRDELTPEHQEIMKLYETEGLKHREIAEKLGISESTSKSRLKRARSKFKDVVDTCCIFEIDTYGNVIDYVRRC